LALLDRFCGRLSYRNGRQRYQNHSWNLQKCS
jgi:hypothetical protein